MLSIYRRHETDCILRGHREPRNINPKCKAIEEGRKKLPCPIQVEGTLNGHMYRESLNTRDWALALSIRDKWTVAGGKVVDGITSKTVADALALWVMDAANRGAAETTLRVYGTFRKQFAAYAELTGLAYIGDWKPTDLLTWRNNDSLTARSRRTIRFKITRVKQFFAFCYAHDLIKSNPALQLPITKQIQEEVDAAVHPFTPEQIERIYEGAWEDGPQTYAFVLAAHNLGLRLSDLIRLGTRDIQGDLLTGPEGTGFLTRKAKTRVILPVESETLRRLQELPTDELGRWFWNGSKNPQRAMERWSQKIVYLLRAAGIKGHAHQFRHTFAVSWLDRGFSLMDVSKMLGHKSIQTTERYYAKFTRTQAEIIEAKMRAAMKPQIVKTATRKGVA